MDNEPVIANEEQLRILLREKGLPLKLNTKLNPSELKLHTVLCGAYDFKTDEIKLEIPKTLTKTLTKEIQKIWHIKKLSETTTTYHVKATLKEQSILTVIKTGLAKDQSIFNAKIHQVILPESWSTHLKRKPKTTTEKINWDKAVKNAEIINEKVTQDINDGKTFNARKDNPWARKNLKNRES
jgi:hypothetical protein